jgi:para-aminobenzoate synthetase
MTSIVEILGVSVTDICERLGVLEADTPFVLLDSAAKPGRYSIIGCSSPTTLQIMYNVGDTFVTLKRGNNVEKEEMFGRDIWSWLASFMRLHKATGCQEIPFWGGLVGTLSYELGVQGLRVHPTYREKTSQSPHPDVNLLFVERSVVFDTLTGKAFVQSLLPYDNDWVDDTAARISTIPRGTVLSALPQKPQGAVVALPDKDHYIASVKQAKEHLFAGDSYEICFTGPTHISLPIASKPLTTWERFKLLRRNNPAPHSAYLRLQPTTFLSSSPERFLSYSRPPHTLCQLRPIKGTVRKAPGITRAVAEELLAGSTKEVAENLMIVDLIRHDLHGVIGEDVRTTQFCKVEEYETVWQLVSVIEGRATPGSSADLDPDGEVGWEVLRRSLPPGDYIFNRRWDILILRFIGSMTGAPKKRSVEILQNLENTERGLYSGVFGYWCVGGGGDWSVTIRSCFKHDDPSEQNHSKDSEEWTIGAGGAITALSDPEAEWEEMVVKLQSVLKTFN